MDMGHKRKVARVKNRTLDFDYKKKYKTTSKPKNTYTNISVFELSFWHFFWIEKIPLYAQDMAKKPKVGPK